MATAPMRRVEARRLVHGVVEEGKKTVCGNRSRRVKRSHLSQIDLSEKCEFGAIPPRPLKPNPASSDRNTRVRPLAASGEHSAEPCHAHPRSAQPTPSPRTARPAPRL